MNGSYITDSPAAWAILFVTQLTVRTLLKERDGHIVQVKDTDTESLFMAVCADNKITIPVGYRVVMDFVLDRLYIYIYIFIYILYI